MEELDFWSLAEWVWTWKEVSEKDRQKVQEDGKKAQQAAQAVKKNQKHNHDIALFLSKVLKRYYNNDDIVSVLFAMIKNIDEYINHLYIIFSPFLNNKTIKNISDYIDYLKENNISKEYINLIILVMEEEKIWWNKFWKSLKSGNSEISYSDFIKEIKDNF